MFGHWLALFCLALWVKENVAAVNLVHNFHNIFQNLGTQAMRPHRFRSVACRFDVIGHFCDLWRYGSQRLNFCLRKMY
jgi:hypothetical protein